MNLEPLLDKIDKTSVIFEGLKVQEKKDEAEKQSAAPCLWDNPKKAEAILKELKYWTNLLEKWTAIKKRRDDLEELSGMVSEENEAEHAELVKEAEDLEKTFQKAHIELVLNGPYDKNDAILILSSGTGGVDAQDWTEMLLRMYLRFAEKQGFKTALTEKTVAAEAGIKSATVEVKGLMAYGYLKSEHGVHRLVRLSPFNAKSLRQTSFALVEVLPVIEEHEGVEIDPKDLRVDTFRSSGAGGQHVNKTDSAVRITHIPTGIAVACQNERSQIQNRARAMAILKAKLARKLQEEQKEKIGELKGDYKEAAWGNQIRSYVFQPYTMVKDHRTKAETSQIQEVMDGDLDLFIEAYLLQSKTSNP
ncbi:peptide chain release factor 2 [Candidatus Peregrinibacteria bacterium]|nr:peptide chain release factor 2 [Candidatus Peregrinibacteria bacterium]